MVNEATFGEILLRSLGDVNDSVAHISRKCADLDENNKCIDKKKLYNGTN